MKIKNEGFTLIELMVTVGIIGILGAIAVPAYQDYTIRSQVTEGLSLAGGAKVAVAEYYSNHGRYPESMSDIGMTSSAGNYIQEINLGENGRINAVFGNDSNKVIHNGTISLVPTENSNGNLEWNCESDIDNKYFPSSCEIFNPIYWYEEAQYSYDYFFTEKGKLYVYIDNFASRAGDISTYGEAELLETLEDGTRIFYLDHPRFGKRPHIYIQDPQGTIIDWVGKQTMGNPYRYNKYDPLSSNYTWPKMGQVNSIPSIWLEIRDKEIYTDILPEHFYN